MLQLGKEVQTFAVCASADSIGERIKSIGKETKTIGVGRCSAVIRQDMKEAYLGFSFFYLFILFILFIYIFIFLYKWQAAT